MGPVLPLLVAFPLLIAGALVMMRGHRTLHVTSLFVTLGVSLAGGIALVLTFVDGGVLAHQVGLWPVGIAIPFVADMFSALMITVTSILTLVCVVFAIASKRSDASFFAPLILVLNAGINGALLTGDLFNLFVFIEVMLLPSYALFVLSAPTKARLRKVAGARLYVVVNLLTSTVFLAGVAFVYGTAGTVNLAQLAGMAAEDPTVAIACAVVLFALGIKAAVVPVHGWLTRAYPSTSPAMSALFSGLHTKVAIYAIYRIYSVVFDGDSRFLWIGIAVFSATMLIGVMGAVGESTMRSILAFHMVSQIGYILMGVALFTQVGLTAGIFYLLHHMIVKASLFLSTGAVEVAYGTGTIGKVSGIAKREPLIAVAFFVAAMSLAGIPPFSGFVAKFSLILAALDAGQIVAVVLMVVVSLITLLSMLKIWRGVFWGRPSSPEDQSSTESDSTGASAIATDTRTTTTRRIGAMMAAPAIVLASITVMLGLGGELLLGLSSTAADGLLDSSGYIEAVIDS